jgi:phosphoribosyl 1,2-cyclic phosphodiesterase
VYVNERTRKAGRAFNRIGSINEFETGISFEAGGYLISPRSLPHDAADPVAFVIEKAGAKMGSVTDLGAATDRLIEALSGCDLLILEFNHDPQMLRNGPYPANLKERVSSGHGHLSNQQAAELLRAVLHPGLRHLFLAHISQTNNLPHLALLAAEDALHRSNAEPAIHFTWQNFVSPVACI